MNSYQENPRKSYLRVAYVWRDEVMADVVATKPRKITLGGTRGCTFVTPDLGLPKRFAVILAGSSSRRIIRRSTWRACLR